MSRTSFPALCVFLCLFASGCRSTSQRMSTATEQPSAAAVQDGGLDVVENGKVANTDNAEQVLQSCGRPSSDQVLAIYNKVDQGPVRRMVYRQLRVVTVEFIPSHPLERSKAKGHLSPILPTGSVWRFDAAHVPKEVDAITAARLKLFLPCAAKALRGEF